MPELYDARVVRCPRGTKDLGEGQSDTKIDADTEAEIEAMISTRRD